MNEAELIEAWPGLLRQALRGMPIVQDLAVQVELPAHAGMRPDGLADCLIAGEPHRLVIECKRSAQPLQVRGVVSQLAREVERSSVPCQGLLVAPFVSPASRAILAEAGMGWLDMAGNARIAFSRLHVEINKTERDPWATKRVQRSLFYPKSARLLKLLLAHPGRSWRVAELAEAASVSVGQVSNVRQALMEREWAVADAAEGMRLVQPGALLDAWRDAGEKPTPVLLSGYTLLTGAALQAAVLAAFTEASQRGARLLLASHSVARRVAPFLRVAGEFLYADVAGLAILQSHLQLQRAPTGANVTVFAAADDGLWQERMPLGTGLEGTGPVQTYLDLCAGGERSREAAEHWRAETMHKLWEVA
jgi:hypothetical protein